MDDFDDILHGRGEREYDSYEPKARRRTRDVKDAVTLLAIAVSLQAQATLDGAVRTKILELAAKAKALAQAST